MLIDRIGRRGCDGGGVAGSRPCLAQPRRGRAGHEGPSPAALSRGPPARSGHAGSWREFPGGRCAARRCARLLPAGEGLDHDHAAAAARTRRTEIRRVSRFIVIGWWSDREQPAGERDTVLACGTREKAVMADPVEPARQDMEQEAADELIWGGSRGSGQ